MKFIVRSDFEVAATMQLPLAGTASGGDFFVVHNYGDFGVSVDVKGSVDETTLFTESVNKVHLSDAEDISYDNAASGLTADDMQEAVDELLVAIQNNAGITNLSYTPAPNNGLVVSDTGADATIPLTDATNAGLFSSVQKDKLDALVVNFKGVFQELINVQQAFPVGTDGDWAIVRNTNGPADWAAWDADTATWGVSSAGSIVGQCNLSNTPTATNTTIHSDTGTDTIISASTAVIAGLMSAADKVKLDTVEANAKDDQNASEVPSTSFGITNATDVQGAIESLTTNKVEAISLTVGNFPLTVGITPKYVHNNVTSSGATKQIPAATTTLAGVMTNVDKIKLDASITDASLSNTPSPTAILIATTGGADTSIPLADATNAGLISAAEKAKLAAVEAGAQPDQIASEVPSNAFGTTGATNVQAAIAEITTEKVENIIGNTVVYTPTKIVPIYTQTKNAVNTGFSLDLNAATTSTAGVMSAADKVKLDTLDTNYKGVYQDVAALNTAFPTGNDGEWAIVLDPVGPAQHYSWDDNSSSWEAVDFASISGTTNLSNSSTASSVTVTSDTGADTTLPAANSGSAGVMTAAQVVDLTNTSSQADANTGLIVSNTNNISANAASIAAIDTTVDLASSHYGSKVTIFNTKGTNADINLVGAGGPNEAGLMAPADKIKLDTVETNAKDDQTAAEVPFTAGGFLSSINVQSAIEELRDEKVQITSSTITINVAVGDSIQDAVNSLSLYRFKGAAYGRIILAAGAHSLPTAIRNYHPQADKCRIEGTGPIVLPVEIDYVDNLAADEAMLRTKFATQINCAAGFIVADNGEDIRIENVAAFGIGTGVAIQSYYNSLVNVTSVAVHGFSYGATAQFSGVIIADNLHVAHVLYGGYSSYGSNVSWTGGGVFTSTKHGYYAFNFSLLRLTSVTIKDVKTTNSAILLRLNSASNSYSLNIKNIGGYGFNGSTGCSIYSVNDQFENVQREAYGCFSFGEYRIYDPKINGLGVGILNGRIVDVQGNAFVNLSRVTGTGINGRTCRLYYDSQGVETGPHGAGIVFSPAVGVIGNDRSKWI